MVRKLKALQSWGGMGGRGEIKSKKLLESCEKAEGPPNYLKQITFSSFPFSFLSSPWPLLFPSLLSLINYGLRSHNVFDLVILTPFGVLNHSFFANEPH
ncbi:hypothetical protein O6P43_018407 [Quillaja saponaria]|uniref:Uncharacterized protein n=1 Tax=Quillaja saponaria TaxID=32244 RepID=A0AAD7LS29_QUISA|nr:hypothetical protein O6P43_018407 [Quillaja saponaria]